MRGVISFGQLNESDLETICRWFNYPHIQRFYSLREWTLEEVRRKLTPYIKQEVPIHPYLIYMDGNPIGYFQYSRVNDYPWPDQDFTSELIKTAACIDLFIGEENLIGKGLGVAIIHQALIDLIWPNFSYCVLDPDVRNISMIKCAEKVGFKLHKTIATSDPLKRPVQLNLMLIGRDK